ncbi:calcineurin B homologous protein 1 isoform X2 [Lynx canadensis]|uniref:calcineurin B homologous protein 1 isoform X2 n=1 Tax=Lynx canadensis TaxID=61383 RepID=UPI0011B0D126|nr:calcineurin B homologous protein 1 isoform X2 [Lynx canadensis]
MLPGAWSALRNTRPCAGLIHSGAGAKSVNVDFCAGCSLAPNWLVLGPPSSARHLWVPSLVRSKNTALSSLDPWASLPSLPLSRRRCRFRRPCSRSSFRLGDGVSGFHVIAGRRARGDQEGDWLFPQSDHPPLQPIHQPGQRREWDSQPGRFPTDSRTCHQPTGGPDHQCLLSGGLLFDYMIWIKMTRFPVMSYYRCYV